MIKLEKALKEKIPLTVSWSGGKDSTATIILAHEMGIEISKIVHCRLFYDKEIPANPFLFNFIEDKSKIFEKWGYHVDIVSPSKTYKDMFFKKVMKSKIPERNGKMQGGLLAKHCKLTDEKIKCLQKPSIRKIKKLSLIGIASDEVDRLDSLSLINNISLLAAKGFSENDALKKCIEYDMVSPLYSMGSKRDGCFFCPFRWKHLDLLRKNFYDIYLDYKRLWFENEHLIRNDKYCFNLTFRDVFNYAERPEQLKIF